MTAASPERAAYEAGLFPPVIPWEHLGPEDKAGQRRIAQAAIEASPELREALAVIDGLRVLVARKQEAINSAGIALWHEPTFTAAEILAVIDGTQPAPVPERGDPTLCARCGTNPVAVPKAGPFGRFCEDCIDLCHESTDVFHRCPVCTPGAS